MLNYIFHIIGTKVMKSSETAKEDDIFLRFQRIFLAFFKREGALRRFFALSRSQ